MDVFGYIVVATLMTSFAAEGRPQLKGEAVVKRENGRVWIEGVPELKWGESGDCTFVGALAAALKVTPHPYGYQDMMGASGLAFRTRWFQDGPKWCPSSPVGEFPEEMSAIEKATGWKLGCTCLLGEKTPDMARFAPDIARSIGGGVPVLAYEPGLNMATVYGYEEGGKNLLLRDYIKGSHPLPTEKLGAMIVMLKGHADPLPAKEALTTALKTAGKNWDRGKHDRYWYGSSALHEWAKDLRAADKFTKEQRDQLFFVSWWNFEALMDARHSAAGYLKEGAALLGGEAGAGLRRAADIYQAEAGRAGESSFGKKEAFLGPWTGKSIADWTPDVREREAAFLDRCRRDERLAISHIETALAAQAGGKGRVEVPGVEVLKWGQSKDHTFINAVAAAMQAAGDESVTYDWLMGATGAAFRVQISTDPFCPSAACAPCGYDCFAEIPRVLGFKKLPGWTPKENDSADRTRGLTRIRRSIDKGVPVFFASEESGLVYGYQAGGRDLLATSYNGGEGEQVLDAMPWGFSFMDGSHTKPNRADVARASLKLALTMAGTPSRGGYYCGAEAYTRWIDLLRHDDWLSVRDKDRLFNPMLGNAYCYDLLVQARVVAARYLRLVANDLGPDSRSHVLKAASLYDQVGEALSMPCVGVLYPWGGAKWTHEMRVEEADKLENALALERRAWGELRAALAPT